MPKKFFRSLWKSNDEKESVEDQDHISTLVSFGVFGCLINISYSVILSGTQDILAGTHIPTTTLLSINFVPQFLIQTIVPYFLKRIPHAVRVLIVFSTAFTGFGVVAFADNVYWRIAGSAIINIGSAIGLICMASVLSYFTPSATAAYSTGCGIGIFTGTLYYTALTTWICATPTVTLALMSPLSLLYVASYYVIMRNKDKKYLETATHEDVAYSRIDDKRTEDEQDDEDRNQVRGKDFQHQEVNQTEFDTNEEDPARTSKEKDMGDEPLTRKEKMLAIAKLFSLTVFPSFLTFFAYFASIQAVITTVAFKNAPFRARDHYLYYVFTSMSGEMFGRCLRSLLSLISSRLHYTPSCKLLWGFCIIEICCFVLLFSESWFRFLPNVAVVIFLCFLGGTILGSVFENVLTLLHITFEGKEREFLMAYAMFPMSAGSLVAAFGGIEVESILRKHCISIVVDSVYCFTRSPSMRDVAARCRSY